MTTNKTIQKHPCDISRCTSTPISTSFKQIAHKKYRRWNFSMQPASDKPFFSKQVDNLKKMKMAGVMTFGGSYVINHVSNGPISSHHFVVLSE